MAETVPAYMQLVQEHRRRKAAEQEPETERVAPVTEASMSRSEIMAKQFEELVTSPEFKRNSEEMAKSLRSFLIENCQIELPTDPAVFAQQVRDGVAFPKTCEIIADVEYVFDSLSRGSLTDGLKKRLNELM